MRIPFYKKALPWLAAMAGGVAWAYYWRVFFGLDARGWPPVWVTFCCAGLALAALAAARAVRRLRTFAARGAACVFLCGLLFVFANPPLQAPDETDHYLRTYAISTGHLDFDAARAYPDDVAELTAAFPGAWVNAHTSVGIGADPDTGADKPYDTAGYALKQYGRDGTVQSILDAFAQYFAHDGADTVTEPISFLILPFLPGAVGMALARLFGGGALACLYAGRVCNLAAYSALCFLALCKAHKGRAVFLCVMLLPTSLFMAASLSYDATLLACCYLMLSLLTQPVWNGRTLAVYAAACVWVNGAKPYLSLLWAVLPLLVPKADWRARLRRWQAAALCAAASLGLTAFVEWYGTALRHNYAPIARQGGEAVDGAAQLVFVLRNPLRYLAVLLGTLAENDFFVGQLGVFGWKDLPIGFINLTAPLLLVFAALAAAGKPGLGRRRGGGLLAFAVVYAAGAMTAMYITYTPVGMVRVVGLQARYFLPVFLALALGLVAALRRVLAPRQDAERCILPLCAGYAAFSAVLLFQHYFVGPVYTIYA